MEYCQAVRSWAGNTSSPQIINAREPVLKLNILWLAQIGLVVYKTLELLKIDQFHRQGA